MGRKNIKKNLVEKTINNKNDMGVGPDNTLAMFIKTVVAVLAVIAVVYLVLNTFMGKDDVADDGDIDYTEDLGYSKILAQDTFNKPESEYVVFFMNGEEGKEEVNNYFGALAQGTVAPKIYVVDMSEQVNSKYLFDNTEAEELYGEYADANYNKSPANIGELQVYKFPTVVHVSSGKSVGYYEEDEFYEALGITNPNAAQQTSGY